LRSAVAPVRRFPLSYSCFSFSIARIPLDTSFYIISVSHDTGLNTLMPSSAFVYNRMHIHPELQADGTGVKPDARSRKAKLPAEREEILRQARGTPVEEGKV
jgi:hypothetical protein